MYCCYMLQMFAAVIECDCLGATMTGYLYICVSMRCDKIYMYFHFEISS